MIDLISEDGIKVSAPDESVKTSKVLTDMMEDVTDTDSIPVLNVNGNTLKRIVEWGTFHSSHDDTKTFDERFFNDMDEDSLLQLLLATHYLNMEQLMDLGAKRLAVLLEDKSDEEILQILNIDNVHFKKRCSCCGCLQTDEDASTCCASVTTEDAPESTAEDEGPASAAPVSL